jgi:hypothetical protein
MCVARRSLCCMRNNSHCDKTTSACSTHCHTQCNPSHLHPRTRNSDQIIPLVPLRRPQWLTRRRRLSKLMPQLTCCSGLWMGLCRRCFAASTAAAGPRFTSGAARMACGTCSSWPAQRTCRCA